MNFNEYKIEDIQKAMTNLIKRHKTIASATQEMLMGIGYEIEAGLDTLQLTRFITQLSDVDSNGKLELSAVARQVGFYMKDHMPVEWDRETQSFVMAEDHLKFDFAAALTKMEATRWDKYKKMKADEAFDADKILQRAFQMIKSVVAKHDEGSLADDDPAYMKARQVVKAF